MTFVNINNLNLKRAVTSLRPRTASLLGMPLSFNLFNV